MKLLSGFIALSLTAYAHTTLAEDAHANHSKSADASSSVEKVFTPAKSDIIKYVCPMHPQIIRDHPSTCPICGMDLVQQIFQQSEQSPKISVNQTHDGKAMEQGLAIKTNQVQKITLWKYIPTFGKVVVDETKVAHIHPRSSGWIKDLQVNNDGELVTKGQLLYNLYAPEILSAQQDLILAYENSYSGRSIKNAAKARLKLLGMDDDSIAKVIKAKQPLEYIPVYAPQDGTVLNLSVQNGMYVQPGTEVVSLADLSSVWVEVEVLPLQQNWLKTGLTVNLTSDAYPNRRWENSIEYLYPTVDPKTQATVARIPLDNRDGVLKPDMYLDAEIYGGPKRNTLAIPMSAVIDDGNEKRVVKQLEDGRFEVVKIVTGMQTRNVVEIYSGLNEGDRIVTAGQFLIDSESQIQTNLMRLMQAGADKGNDQNSEESGFTPVNNEHAGH